ncbi:hypothetical protein E1J29_11575 [Xanthomonas hortorum pv. vitians]|nr:hypothetical protein [Xanthomonas hortorum pv. vitians]NMI43965.1 hypothetical protein [Xanthomonas hortorum pv. vitians]
MSALPHASGVPVGGAGIGESGIGNRESGIGNRDAAAARGALAGCCSWVVSGEGRRAGIGREG